MHKIWNPFLAWKITYLTRWVTHWLKQWSNTLLLRGGKTRGRNFIIQCHTAHMTRQKIFFSFWTVFRHPMNIVDGIFLLAYVHFSLSLYLLCVQKYFAWFFFLFFSSPYTDSSREIDFTFWSFMSKDIIDYSFCTRICTECIKAIARWKNGFMAWSIYLNKSNTN